jgi:hypothetical protein
MLGHLPALPVLHGLPGDGVLPLLVIAALVQLVLALLLVVWLQLSAVASCESSLLELSYLEMPAQCGQASLQAVIGVQSLLQLPCWDVHHQHLCGCL